MNTSNVVRLQHNPDGPAAGMRTALRSGRYEIVSGGPNPELAFVHGDPYDTNAGTGIVVPNKPTGAGGRYLIQLARAAFLPGEKGVRLVGIRQYAELVARIPPTAPDGSVTVLRREITQPMWHPPDGNISWHVMVTPRVQRDSRHPANSDGATYQDSTSPTLLFQTPFPAYTPPNGGRPWGTPIAASLGNMHDLRYRWLAGNSEYVLDIPIPLPCDVTLYASVRQNDPCTNPSACDATGGLTDRQFAALSDEDKFLMAYCEFAQYGIVAGSLVFDENLGRDVP